ESDGFPAVRGRDGNADLGRAAGVADYADDSRGDAADLRIVAEQGFHDGADAVENAVLDLELSLVFSQFHLNRVLYWMSAPSTPFSSRMVVMDQLRRKSHCRRTNCCKVPVRLVT